MWVRFTAPFTYKPKRSVTLAYRSGDTANVVHDLAEAAIKAGAAVEMRKASRTADPVEIEVPSE